MDVAGRPLALTLGDPAGIGPDIVLLAWTTHARARVPPFVVLGDEAVLTARAEALGLDVPIRAIETTGAAAQLFAGALPLLPVKIDAPVVAGRPDAAAMPAVMQSIELGVELVRRGAARALVTNPVSKATLYAAGFPFPGHTEYLAALAADDGLAPRPVMMLAAGDFRVVPATVHMPLKDVPAALNEDLVLSTIETTARDLGRFFGLKRPRLAVSGLNPHGGEDGHLGREEIDIIAPAVEAGRRRGLDVTGPHPADTMFHEAARKGYDAAICMYHDQALAPFKALAFDRGVNVTFGLPFARTSPDHGTAFALAGTGKASARSLIEALRLADAMSREEAARGVEAHA